MKAKFKIPIMFSALALLGASAQTRQVIVGEPAESIQHALYVKLLDPGKVELRSLKWR